MDMAPNLVIYQLAFGEAPFNERLVIEPNTMGALIV
jgi:hypothetical protein